MIGNDKLEGLLREMLQNEDMLRQAGAEAGIHPAEGKEN